jgi:hypothetical protein
MVDFVNKLDNEGKTPQLFEELNNYRIDRYKSLNKPYWIKGWLNRVNAFYIINKPYAISKQAKTTTIAVGVLLIVAGVTLYYKYARTK